MARHLFWTKNNINLVKIINMFIIIKIKNKTNKQIITLKMAFENKLGADYHIGNLAKQMHLH